MFKRSFNTELVGALTGAGLGYGLTALKERSLKPDSETALSNTMAGSVLGLKVGLAAEFLARLIRRKQMEKSLSGLPDTNKEQLKKVIKAFKGVNIPVYIQDSGTPYDNAFYIEGSPQWGVFGERPTFKDAITGRKVTNPASAAIYVGKNFRKLPIVAHELGHATDFKDKSNLERFSLGVGRTVEAIGTGASVGLLVAGMMGNMEPEDVNKGLMVTGSAALGSSIFNKFMTKRLERRASDKAIQVLKRLQRPKQLDQSKDALLAAYSTYDPIRLSDPDFGSGKYYKE